MVEALAAGALCFWIYLAFFHGRFWRLKFPLRPAPPLLENAGSRRIAVVIPARNEAATIGATVDSLVNQDWPGLLHIWVVDDSSSDGTAEMASQSGEERISIVQAGSLPPGWTGKVWAMSRGYERAVEIWPDYVLFTDADIVHAPESLRELVARAERETLDLVSVMVKLNCASAAERLLIPAFVFFFFMLYPPERVWRSNSRTAGAAGGCILIRPEALARAGGLESIRGELIDDCALAHRVKSSGGAIWLGMSRTTRSIREYPTFADIRRMVSRTAFTQLRYSAPMLVGTVAGMLFVYVVPVLSGSVYGLLAWALMSLLYAPMLRFYGVPVLAAPLLPAVAVFYVTATVESAYRFWSGRGGSWKDRHQAAQVS